MSSPDTPAREFWAAVRAQVPILIGVAPFGLIYGALAVNSGLSPLFAQATSSILFAGSAQFVAVPLFAEGASLLVLVATTFIVNLRHALYSASLAPHIRSLGWGWKLLLAYLLTDEAYVVGILRYDRDDHSPHRHWYVLGSGLGLWTTWQISTAIGVFFGAQIPESWGLDFALAVTFIAMIVPGWRGNRPALVASLVGGVVAVVTSGLPNNLGLVIAALVGMFAGLLAETRWPMPPRRALDDNRGETNH